MEVSEKSEWARYLYYDESSPSYLRWKISRYKIKAHSVAGGISAGPRQGYYRVKVNGELAFAHRIIWELHNDRLLLGEEIDHMDGNKLNNRITNLRKVSRTINCHNKALQLNNKTGVAGVSKTNNGQNNFYYTASWSEGKRSKSKNFSIGKLGEDEAFRLAVEFRLKKIEELNELGQDYTDRHGQ